MEDATSPAPDRVSLQTARDSVIRLRKALEHLDIPMAQIREIIPASDMSGSHYVRMGLWNPEHIDTLVDGIEGLAEAREALRHPPLIGRVDGPPLLPPEL